MDIIQQYKLPLAILVVVLFIILYSYWGAAPVASIQASQTVPINLPAQAMPTTISMQAIQVAPITSESTQAPIIGNAMPSTIAPTAIVDTTSPAVIMNNMPIPTASSIPVMNTPPTQSAPIPSLPSIAAPTSCLGPIGPYTYPYGSRMVRGNTLDTCSGLQSPDTDHVAVQQSDGNFVIYNIPTGKAIWSTNTYMQGVQPNNFTYQTDGNLVVYDSAGKAYWSPNVYGKPSTTLVMQNDGNLVLYNGTPPPAGTAPAIWASNTYGK